VAAGFVDEVVEIVEGTEGWVDGLGVSGVGLEGGEEEAIDAEGLDVVEVLSDAVEAAAAGWAEVGGVYLVDDGVLPPDVGVDAGASPAGAGEDLSDGGRDERTGEAEGEESARCQCSHASVIEMLREKMGERN
jgi:hypothetical protein